MEQAKNAFFWLIGALVIIWSFYMFLGQPAPAKYQAVSKVSLTRPVIKVGEQSIFIEIADTDEKRSLGLSYRRMLPPGTGMLFIFDTPGIYGFWMRDMKFALDIVWIDENWVVVGVARNVPADSYPQSYVPPSQVKYVLEINSGEASSLGIDTGTRLYFDDGK